MDPCLGIMANLTVDNWSTWSKQFSVHLKSEGLYKYIADIDALVTQTEHARIGTTTADNSSAAESGQVQALTATELGESQAIRDKDHV